LKGLIDIPIFSALVVEPGTGGKRCIGDDVILDRNPVQPELIGSLGNVKDCLRAGRAIGLGKTNTESDPLITVCSQWSDPFFLGAVGLA
jgi:hypothetical protein